MKKTFSQLRKEASIAPKYTLYIPCAGFLAQHQNLTGIEFTNDITKAMLYSVGFDNDETKLGYWNAKAKFYFNNSSFCFKLLYLLEMSLLIDNKSCNFKDILQTNSFENGEPLSTDEIIQISNLKNGDSCYIGKIQIKRV